MGKQQKYVAVNTYTEDQENDLTPAKKYFTSLCIWSSLRTAILLSVYFAPSIGLTFYQRWLLQKLRFPLTIVVCHLVVKFILSTIVRQLIECRNKKPAVQLNWANYCKGLAAVGLASGIDVGFSNWGLEFVTITLYTLTKSTTIIFILGCAILFKLEKKSWSLSVTVIMISFGLMLFTYQATQFSLFGFIILLFASFTSGIRWTCAQLLLQKSKLGINNPVDMVYFVQPWMIISVLPFAIGIEGEAFISNCKLVRFSDWALFTNTVLKVLIGALIAFVMELSEFLVVRYTSSLTLSIGGIFKDVLLIGLGVEYNGDQISLINFIGLLVCISGIASHVIHKIRHPNIQKPTNYYEEIDTLEMGEPLISDKPDYILNSSEDELSDTQELFNILHSHDR